MSGPSHSGLLGLHTGLDWNEVMELNADERANPHSDALTALQLGAANAVLNSLSPQMRAFVLLTYHSGYSHTESAAL